MVEVDSVVFLLIRAPGCRTFFSGLPFFLLPRRDTFDSTFASTLAVHVVRTCKRTDNELGRCRFSSTHFSYAMTFYKELSIAFYLEYTHKTVYMCLR